MRVEDVSGTDAHVADLLALYHLDALDRRSSEQVGRHLQSCQQCRAAATEVCETLAALALLGDHGDQLLNRYGALGTAVPPAFPARFAPQEPAGPSHREAQKTDRRRFRLRRGGRGTGTQEESTAAASGVGWKEPAQQRLAPPPAAPPPVTPPPAAPPPVTPPPAAPPPVTPRPVGAAPAAPVREPSPVRERATPSPKPAAERPLALPSRPSFDRPPDITRPDDSQRAQSARKRFGFRRTATFAGLSALLLLTLTVAGLSAKALLDPPAPAVQTATVRTAVASATDQDSGATLSILLTEDGERVTARATLSGLDKSVGYRLYGYTFDGRQRPLVNWTGRAGVQEVGGELPVGIADLSHFAVTRGTRVVVTAYLPRDAGPAATPGR